MIQIRLIPLIVTLALFVMGPVWANGANSPEALAMAFANSHRSGDVAAIVALHHFVPTQQSSAAEQQALARREWRALIQQYQISGYRLSMLTAEERQHFRTNDSPGLAPVKKLVISLTARAGAEKQTSSHYVGRIAGRYLLINGTFK